MTDQLEALRVALGDRYQVEREVGSGGMAVVYLARDTKHDRDVALKVLHPDLAASIGTDRFLREIRITAGLQHPHILPLYDSGEAGGFLYYVMPFVEGETLSDALAREAQLPIPEAVRYVREAAEALAYAHGHGLIHRDIKPSNIFVSGGHAVLADFGIARAVEEAGTEKITQTGTAVGTPAYMSPEQATGQVNVDARTDIYSLGCVLYELLVGQVPFTGPTPMAVMARHSMDQVPPPHIMRDTISAELEEIIYRSMAKSPADRYRTAAEMAEALKDVGAAQSGTRHPSPAVGWTTAYGTRKAPWRWWGRAWIPASGMIGVLAVAGLSWGLWARSGVSGPGVGVGDMDPGRVAVLYFEDLSGGDLNHVADGLTEGLISELSRVPALRVVSTDGIAPYRNSDLPRERVAEALNAGTLIVGSVETAGDDRIRINTRLLEGGSGADIGRRSSTVIPVDDLSTAQDSVARDVGRVLREWLGTEIEVRERRAGTRSAAAWTLYQRAERLRKEAVGMRGAEATALLDRADSLLADAEGADPEWIDPTILRAEVAGMRSQRGPAEEAIPALETGLSLADRALARTPNHARALEARGTLRYMTWFRERDPVRRERILEMARRDLEEAVAVDGSRASAYAMVSHLHHEARKDLMSAALAARNAYAVDAFLRNADQVLDRLFWTHYNMAQFPDARRWCDEGRRRFAHDWRFVQCRLYLQITPEASPDPDLAWSLAYRLDSIAPAHRRPFWERHSRQLVAGVLARAGHPDSARNLLAEARTRDREIDPGRELPGWEAIIRAQIGDADTAIELLREYVVMNPDHIFQRDGTIVWWWIPIRDHPEFRQLLAAAR